MKMKDFKRTKEELNEQKRQNNEQIYINDERTKMAKVNQLDYKLGTTLAFSVIPYFIVIMVGIFIDMNALTNVISPEIIPIMITGSSLGIGTIINYLHQKKYETKERFLSFSQAKKETEKIEEEVYYQIEFEKANNRNKVIDKAIDTLDSNQILLKTISSKYNISERSPSLTEEESKQRLEELSKILVQKYNELDILTTKKVLNDNFWRIRSKVEIIMNTMVGTALGGLLSLMFTTFLPFITMDNIFGNVSMLIREIYFLTPLITGTLGTAAYWIKRNIDRKKAFIKLNNKLGEYALPEKIKFENNDTQELENLIEKLINDISVAEVQFRKQKRAVENIAQTEEREESINQNIANSLGRNSVENIIDNPTQFPDGIHLPTTFEIPQSEPDISWVQPYLEEDIEEDVEPAERTTGDNQPSQGPKLVRKNNHHRTKNGVGY